MRGRARLLQAEGVGMLLALRRAASHAYPFTKTRREEKTMKRPRHALSSIGRRSVARCFTASALVWIACSRAHAQAAHDVTVESASSSAASVTLAPIIVVAATPLTGVGLPLTKVAANVQIVRASPLEAQHRDTLTAYFEKNLPSVDVNDQQGNPYQVTLNYRGFMASALLGAPEGLSVFMDGVRINEPFGDVVNWDLVPRQAIDTIELMPGSNPIFGLNTLGGALAIRTKNGKDHPGGDVEITGGSFGRKTIDVEQGGRFGDRLDYYVTGNLANDNGWAQTNASRIRQIFGKLRYTDADTTIALSAGGADNDLHGSQTIPRSFLTDFRQPYTFPDENRNRVGYVTLSGEHDVSDSVELSGAAYYRHFVNRNASSNTNADYGQLQPDGRIDTLQATNVDATVATDSFGASLQLTLLGKLGGMENQLVAGLAADFANARYTSSSEDAFFTPTRATVGIGGAVQQVNAHTRDGNLAAYLQDTVSLTPQWALTLSARYDWSKKVIADAGGTQPKLDGSHVFSRLNPALGLTWHPAAWLTAYATYNEGMRTPTAIELACADPAAPCSLPNDFVADPALAPVISKTVEAGLRGKLGKAITWSAAVYRTTLLDDIQFISAPATTQGYFQNVGNTRRQGIELSGHTRLGALGVTASYSRTDATYRSSWTANSPSNASADANGHIVVRPGNRIPGIPANSIKCRLDYAATQKWTLGTNLTYRSGVYARGNENNADANGKVAGYLLVDIDTTYRISKRLQLFANVSNLLNKRYASFASLGQNFFNGPHHTFDGFAPINEAFVGPGAPRGAWIGMHYGWD
jgi:iron complex outermembrane recepter protein